MFQSEAVIYISDIPATYTEDKMREIFSKYGEIEQILLRKYRSVDFQYSFIQYKAKEQAEKAFDEANFMRLETSSIFIQFMSPKIRQLRFSSDNAVLISGVSPETTNKSFYDKYKSFGKIIFSYLVQNKGYGYIQYETKKAAKAATESDANITNYTYKPLAKAFQEVVVNDVSEEAFPGIKSLFEKLGEIKNIEKVDKSYYIRFADHKAADSAFLFFNMCIVGSSIVKVDISPRETDYFHYYLLEAATHMGDEDSFVKVALKNLPNTVTCGQHVREICEKYGAVQAPRLNLNEKWESLGTATCTMISHQDALNVIEGLKRDNSQIIAARSMSIDEAKLYKEVSDLKIYRDQTNSSKDRQFLVTEPKELKLIKDEFKSAMRVDLCGSLALVMFKTTELMDAAVSNYNGKFGSLLFFEKVDSMALPPLGKSWPPQQRFPFRNNVRDRFMRKVLAMRPDFNENKFKDVTPEVARFLLGHEKVMNAWLDE